MGNLDPVADAEGRIDIQIRDLAQTVIGNVVMRQAMQRTWKHLAKERLEDVRPNIPLGDRFWPLSDTEKQAIDELSATDAVLRLITSLKSRQADARITVLDAAFWMKGYSSLGLLRYAVLVGVGKASP